MPIEQSSRYSHALSQCEAVAESAETRLELAEQKSLGFAPWGFKLVGNGVGPGSPKKLKAWSSCKSASPATSTNVERILVRVLGFCRLRIQMSSIKTAAGTTVCNVQTGWLACLGIVLSPMSARTWRSGMQQLWPLLSSRSRPLAS